jgi:hypothetical protein
MLLNTFSPMMVEAGCQFTGRHATFEEIRAAITRPWPWRKDQNDTGFANWFCANHAVGHEVTAHVLSVALDALVKFEGRKNITLSHDSMAHVIIPNFRPLEGSREFTREEVEAAGFRCFLVQVFDPEKPRYEVSGQLCDVGGSLVGWGKFHTIEEARRVAGKQSMDWDVESVWIHDSHAIDQLVT